MPFDVTRTNTRRDALTAVGLLLVAVLGVIVTYDHIEAADELHEFPTLTTSVLALAAVIAPLAARRIQPAAVAVVVTVAFLVTRVLRVPEGSISSLAIFLAIYTVGAWDADAARRMWTRGFSIVAATGVLTWSILEETDFVDVDAVLGTLFTVLLNAIFFVAAWKMGDLARAQRVNEAELAERADQLALEREARAQRAVVDERVRIARELHDVVAHHVSVMGVQAGAARRVLAGDPGAAAGALAAIEESGRQAVGELQKLVDFLRSGEEGQMAGPQPRLDELPALCAQSRAAGLPIELRTVGTPRPVPASVELTAYRIVQESLTNVLKHAGTVQTTVVLTYTAGSLEVEVVNTGGVRTRTDGGGRGLVGMRERAAMVGGRFSAGATHSGGYRVSASLPTGTSYEPTRADARATGS